VLWDKTGGTLRKRRRPERLIVDGKIQSASKTMGEADGKTAGGARRARRASSDQLRRNNDGTRFPRATASSPTQNPVSRVNDGNYWYTVHPPNRWTCEGSRAMWIGAQSILDQAPDSHRESSTCWMMGKRRFARQRRFDLEYWDGAGGRPCRISSARRRQPTGHWQTSSGLRQLETGKLRAVITHQPGAKSGLSEFEAGAKARSPRRRPGAPRKFGRCVAGREYPKTPHRSPRNTMILKELKTA